MLLVYIWVYGGFALATVVCAAACWWGGPPERVCAATFWIAWALSLLVGSSTGNHSNLVVLIDIICLVVFTALSFRTRRVWTLLVAASQVDDVISHFTARMLQPGVWSYAVTAGIWGGEFILACLIGATIAHQLRLKRQAALQAV